MRRRFTEQFLRCILLTLLLLGIKAGTYAQGPTCGPGVPFFNADLSGNPGGTWTSNPPLSRNGLCCNAQSPDKCVEFLVTLDNNAIGINFQIASGAVPPGALFYQIDCGPMVPVGSPICLNGPGPYHLTFCKPGNNINTYSITSIPKPAVSPATTTSDGCNINIGSTGLVESSITWTSIAPGTQGQYNNYLNCTTGCDTVKVSPLTGYPAYVDYKVCGNPLGGACAAGTVFCDTIRVYFVPPIANAITPNPASYCVNNPGVVLNSVINGGVQPYTYIWKNSSGITVGTNSTYNATSPGNYILEVRDATYPGCPPKYSSVTVNVDPMPSVNAGPDKTVCPGNPNVTLAGTVTNATGGIWSGGTGTYSPSNTSLNAIYTPSASEIAAGMVVLTLTTTGNGACSPVTDQMTINITAPITINLTLPSMVCYGTTANISASVTGGTPPYQYSWSSGQTTSSIYNVSPGNYTVTVTDATQNSCTKSKTAVLNQNPPITLNVPSNDIITCDSSISVTVSAQGGSGVFSYMWNTGASGPTITVNSGTYIITATDSVGCTTKDTVIIQAAGTAISASINQPSILCNGQTTTLTATGNGGFGGYAYSWNNGSSSQNITVGAGNYCVTIEDTVGCLYTSCVEVVHAQPLTVSIPAPSQVCYGGSATVTAIPSGGIPPYQYSWSTGETSESITRPAGTYSVTVTDANYNVCSVNGSVTITQAQAIALNFTSVPVSCFGGGNGSATVTVTGGVSPYNYAWSPYGGNASTAYLLSAGTYSVNITDALGCVKTGTVTVSQPPLLNATISSSSNITCAGSMNGSATVTASGGTPAYTYLWSPSGETSQSASSLPAGSNSVTIQDSKGCTRTASVTISEPQALTAAIGSSTHVSCNGGNDGAATVMISGGTSPYSYTWLETGDNTASVNNLFTGNYNIVIRDANNCSVNTMVTIQQPPALTSSITSSSNVTCYGAANGSATVTVAGGSPGYNYSWSNSGSTTATASGLVPNSYTVTVTDLKGCQTSSTILITQPSLLQFSQASATASSCSGVCDGQVSVTASGGNGGFQYLWTPGNYTSSAVTGLCVGTYSVRVTDSKGCFRDTALVVTEPQPLALSAVITGSNCGQPNGSATISVTGGTPAYTYSWNTSPAQLSSTASGLAPGTYTVTVRDNKNCSAILPVIIQNIPGVNAGITSLSNVTCYNACNGSASLSLSGGTSPYTYSWSTTPPQSGQSANNLCAGTYTVKVTGSDGCSDTETFSITQPASLQLSATSISHVNCYGTATGSATVNATGGSGNYSYTWNTSPAQSGTIAANLYAGLYIATVSDNNGCSDTVHVQISQPASPLQLSATNSNLTCFGGNNATATASVSGGSPGYTYSWNTNPSQSSPTASNLTAGTYSVLVTDSKGCTLGSNQLIVTQPAASLTASFQSTNVLCYGNSSGSATATVSGGTTPYTYSWSSSPVQTGATAVNLPVGNYSVLITDAQGCTTSGSGIAITGPAAALSATITKNHVNCFGGSTGSANAEVSGGTSPYTYSWSTSPVQTGQQATGLAAGTYTVQVTDQNNCTYVNNSVIITQPAQALGASISQTNVNCYGGNTGTATAAVTGGTSSYTYSWSTVPAQSTSTAVNLSAGTYTVIITDSKGCTYTPSAIVITQPQAALNATVNSTHINCFGNNNGTASASVNGGTAPYTYSWNTSPVQSTPVASSLSVGSYSVSITDSKGCTLTSNSVYVNGPAATLSASITKSNVLCYGDLTGSASAAVSGGTTPYTYSWSTSPVQSGSAASGLSAGTYSLNVTDQNGCLLTMNSIIITQPANALSATISSTDVSCNGGNNGTATAAANGGTGNYTYSWNTIPLQTTSSATGLDSGSYTVQVSDANGCVYNSQPIQINQPSAALSVNITKSNVPCYGMTTGSATATPTGGTAPYTYSWSTSPAQSNATANNLPAGFYNLLVTDSKGCTYSPAPIQITQPSAALAGTVSSTDATCYGQSNGSASVSANGGTSPYTYSWSSSPSQSTVIASNLPAGSYFVRITDANGCTSNSANVTVSQPQELAAYIQSYTDQTCQGANNGTATASATGGTGPYYYSWNTNPAQTLATASNLSGGTYVVTITDMKGCTDDVSVSISQPQTVQFVSAGAFATTCNAGCDGYAVVIPGGGTAPYSYSWSNGGTGPSINNLCEGYYTVFLYDNNGCYSDTTLHVTSPNAILLSESVTASNCYQKNGSASVVPDGGMPSYSYSWNTTPPIYASTANGLAPGNYEVTVTDARGCQSSKTVAVPNIPGVELTNAVINNARCKDSCDASVTVSASSGTGPYTFFWNTTPPQFSSTANGLCAGSYKATVKDADGCWDTLSINVAEPTYVQVECSDTARICVGQTATLNASASGGTGQLEYIWNNGQGSGPSYSVSPTSTTVYSVCVKDSNGCRSQLVDVPVFVNAPLSLSYATGDSICPGGVATVSAQAYGGDGNYEYLWMPGSISNSQFSLSPAASTTYYLTVKDGCGSPEINDSARVIVHGIPQISFEPDKRSGCKPLCVNFENTSSVSDGYISSWNWTFSNGSQSSSANPQICFNEDGMNDIAIEAISNFGCKARTSFNNFIEVYPDPVAEFTFGPQPADILNPMIRFTDQSQGAVKWEWDFQNKPDNQYSTEQNPVCMYGDTGSFCPLLKVTNEHGCISEKENCLYIDPQFSFYIPNAFSPNGDGYNETFKGIGTLIQEYEMLIFDRWGNLIYQTEDLEKPWDGRANDGSTPAQEDVYVYKIKVLDVNRHLHEYFGSVTIVK